jgi:hypothetical protein
LEDYVPVLAVIEVPGGSSELDEVLIEAWHSLDKPPSGNRLRMAGPMDGGWRVVSLWDSAEQFREFLEDRLHLSLDGLPGEPTVVLWELEKIHRFD